MIENHLNKRDKQIKQNFKEREKAMKKKKQ